MTTNANPTPSAYQEGFLDFAADPEGGNGIGIAVAGSGKTSTLKMTARRIAEVSPRARIQVVCFNRPVAEELQRKMPPNSDCGTLHSAGKRAWGGRPEIVKDKVRRIFAWLQKEQGEIPKWVPPGKVAKIVGLAKAEGLVVDGDAGLRPGTLQGEEIFPMTGLVPDTDAAWADLFEHYGIDVDDRLTPAVLVGAARKVLAVSCAWAPRMLDFDDMLYMPTLTDGYSFPTSPWVFVDELQDVSGLQREMVIRMVAGGGRLLGVGDPNQAIYGWRGADVGSIDKVAARTSARRLPLSVCYRCPTKVLDLAREIVPQIEAAPGAKEGIVETRDSFRASELLPGHLVLCRNRGPLTRLAYKLLGFGTPVRLLGGNGGEGIVTFIKGLSETATGRGKSPEDVDAMLEELDRWTMRQLQKAQARDDEEAAAEAQDKREQIAAIAEGSRADSVSRLCQQVTELFDGPREGKVLLGTGHASKGLEADHVWILDRDLVPSRGAKLDWQKEQEKNLWYVMLTRARESLRFVRSGGLR